MTAEELLRGSFVKIPRAASQTRALLVDVAVESALRGSHSDLRDAAVPVHAIFI